MSIQNLNAFINSMWDWAVLDGCFGTTKIRPTDIDGLVERNGRFLLLEAKGVGKLVGRGQQKVFDQLQRTGVFTIIIVWGDPGKPNRIALLTRHGTKHYERATIATLRMIVSNWYQWADKQRAQKRDDL